MAPRIYLDHNAGTPLRSEVVELLRDRLSADAEAGNPSSVHADGRQARARLSEARRDIAASLRVDPKHVCFVSSGSEANAWALEGAFLARKDAAKKRIVASAIEHPSTLAVLDVLTRREGAEVVLVSPGPDGAVRADRMVEALAGSQGAALCTLMWANNETGVLQPVEEVAQGCAKLGVPFHTDAVQAAGKVPVDLSRFPASWASFAGHKLGAPAGVGVLVAREPLAPLIPGHQEAGRRAGTPWVPLCEAMALALERAQAEVAHEGPRQAALRDGLERRLAVLFPQARISGNRAPRIPNTTHITFPGTDGETLLIALDLAGISVSMGAACASGSLAPSHVLLAMGMSKEEAQGSLRISVGRSTSSADVETLAERLQESVPKSPRTTAAMASGVPTRSS